MEGSGRSESRLHPSAGWGAVPAAPRADPRWAVLVPALGAGPALRSALPSKLWPQVVERCLPVQLLFLAEEVLNAESYRFHYSALFPSKGSVLRKNFPAF